MKFSWGRTWMDSDIWPWEREDHGNKYKPLSFFVNA